MEESEIVCEGPTWVMLRDGKGGVYTIIRPQKRSLKCRLKSRLKVSMKTLAVSVQAQKYRFGIMMAFAFFGFSTGCMTDIVLTHYQFAKLIDLALKNNPELTEFNGD